MLQVSHNPLSESDSETLRFEPRPPSFFFWFTSVIYNPWPFKGFGYWKPTIRVSFMFLMGGFPPLNLPNAVYIKPGGCGGRALALWTPSPVVDELNEILAASHNGWTRLQLVY